MYYTCDTGGAYDHVKQESRKCGDLASLFTELPATSVDQQIHTMKDALRRFKFHRQVCQYEVHSHVAQDKTEVTHSRGVASFTCTGGCPVTIAFGQIALIAE